MDLNLKGWTINDCLPFRARPIYKLAVCRYGVLDEVDDDVGISRGIGSPGWALSLCLAATWIAVWSVTCCGVRSSGKAAYFLALFPYVTLVMLLIRGVTLPGALDGIIFFVRPDFGRLLDPTVSLGLPRPAPRCRGPGLKRVSAAGLVRRRDAVLLLAGSGLRLARHDVVVQPVQPQHPQVRVEETISLESTGERAL